jgi:serine/threonine protein kinase/Tol biopolymer transport system component
MTPERWQRVEELYHAAVSRPPGERASFLADACGEDTGLRRELEGLLDEQLHSGDGFLAAPVAASQLPDFRPGAMTGRSLGDYQLEAPVGAGGMGEVYRAVDTKLRREVAIKILARAFTSDSGRLARFEREARMLAALNHPNVCSIYGLEEAEGIQFLILEFVEGETLQDVLRRQPPGSGLPVHEALTIGRQIAEALEVAHDRGIIHRDVKPANIKITPSGVVKVLDFGLAKTVAGVAAPAHLTHAPIAAGGERTSGTLVGTAAYMSPEQASGKIVDRRSDVWAFGVVLFEMVAGKRPFSGETAADALLSVLHTSPDWTTLPGAVPPDLRRLIRRCLEKDPRRRVQSIGDARVQIEDLLSGTAEQSEAQIVRRGSPRPALASPIALTVAAAAMALLLVWAWTFGRSAVPSVETHVLSVLPPQGASFATEEAPALSRDGRRVAFVAYNTTGRQQLYVHALDSTIAPQALPNTDGASLPFWAPNSESIGFFAQGKLKTIHVATGRVQTLADAGGARGGTWNQDGLIVFVPRPFEGPSRISAAGGLVEPLRLAGPAAGGWFPSFLPDGRNFLLFVPTVRQPENSAVWVASLDSSPPKRLVNSRSNAVFATPGHLLFWREGTLWAQSFDDERVEVRGTPVPVATAVGLNPLTNQALVSVSNSGTLVFFAGAVVESELVWVGRGGAEIGRPGPRGAITTVTLSPDATSVVYDQADSRTASMDLWQFNFARGIPERLTFNPSHDFFPVWSSDGARVAFSSLRDRPPQLYELAATRAGTEKLLLSAKLPNTPSGWSHDGRLLFYTVSDPITGGDIWALPLGADPYPVVKSANDERYGTPSPDGRWLAYVSNESGAYEVNVQALGAPGVRRQVSANGGFQPQWRRDGRELFYMAPERTLMAIEFESSLTTFAAAPPKTLFATGMKWIEIQGTARTYAVAPDGQRFLLASATEESRSAAITVILNWTGALQK